MSSRIVKSWVSVLSSSLLCISSPAIAAGSYKIEFDGVNAKLEEKLRLVSVLAKGDRALPTKSAIHRVAKKDVDLLSAAMKASGYYNSKITFDITSASDAVKTIINVSIESGPLFKISEYNILYTNEIIDKRPASLSELKVQAPGKADGASLQIIQQEFLTALWDAGYPAAKIVDRHAVADFDSGTAIANYSFDSGPLASFGQLKFDGLLKTEPEYLRSLRKWKEGDTFNKSKIIAYKDSLAQTGLFDNIDITQGTPNATGEMPIFVRLSERKRRTIGAGASYSTVNGPGGRVFFEYRNLFGGDETARVEINASASEQSLVFDINKPMPNFPGEIFAQTGFRNELSDAFDAQTINISAGFSKRWLDDRLTTLGGLAFESSRIKTDTDIDYSYLVSLPISAIWNTEDDPLNLSKGGKISLSITPYTGSSTFTKSELNARGRINFNEQKFTLAGRLHLGATLFSSLAELPINQRYYSGGGSSVRGYGLQAVGPLNTNNVPIGGRSVIEVGLEARARVTQSLQLAGFADTGSVSSKTLPDFNGQFQSSIGAGIRYFTIVGPLRADIAFPLDRRAIDDSFQLYISLGQPF